LHIRGIKSSEYNVVTLLPIPEELIIQITVLSAQEARSNDVSVEGRSDAAVLRKAAAFFQQQSTDSIEQSIVRAIDGKGIGIRSQFTASSL